MKRLVTAFALLLGVFAMLAVSTASAVIYFSEPAAPPVLAAGDSIPGIAQWNFAEIPPTQKIVARDGAPLNYRLYAGQPDRAVVLVHGSSGSGVETHKLAQALQAAGATVYSISLRGHGGSGTRNGDVSYKGQLDDDLADLVKAVKLAQPGVRRTLVGFSSGGGFALRIASGPNAGLFDDYVAISPYIAQDSPTNKADSGWAGVAVPRIVALSILDGFGLPWFQDLPVVHFATQAKADDKRTPIYSFRLLTSLQLGRDWKSELARISKPTLIVIGEKDELFAADQFAPLLRSINPRIAVMVVPGQTHLGMIGNTAATAAVATGWQQLASGQVSR